MSELNHLQAVQSAIDFIEEHLDEDVNGRAVAAQVGFSEFHFYRVFASAIGESVSAYQRRRRLSRAAKQLKGGTEAILAIALSSGFTSQEAFTRSFKKLFGCSPGHYRRHGGLVAMEKVKLTAEMVEHLHGGLTMEPKYVTFPGKRVVGLAEAFPMDASPEIGKLWGRFVEACQRNDALDLSVSFGVCICEHPTVPKKAGDAFVYMASVVDKETENENHVPAEMIRYDIPAGRYAVFTHKGPISTFPHTVKYVWGTWVAENRTSLREGCPDFELYDHRFDPEREDSEVDIFIPVN
jgi:AraC family transcriptional regulator